MKIDKHLFCCWNCLLACITFLLLQLIAFPAATIVFLQSYYFFAWDVVKFCFQPRSVVRVHIGGLELIRPERSNRSSYGHSVVVHRGYEWAIFEWQCHNYDFVISIILTYMKFLRNSKFLKISKFFKVRDVEIWKVFSW